LALKQNSKAKKYISIEYNKNWLQYVLK
jgi:hypothetical protein